MAQVIQQAMRLVSGALGAVSFDQLQPGTLVKDELGRLYGSVVERFVSPVADWHGVDAQALMVVVRVDPEHRDFARGLPESLMAISGRYLEPVQHGPAEVMPGYELLAKLINPHGGTTWRERNRA